MLADEIQKPEEIQDTKKILKMEETNSIIGNPAFPLINENILFCLDHKSQMTFRQVCQSWQKEVDQPLFWIKKLNLKSHAKELGNAWIELVGRIQKGSDLEKEIIECLMKWYGKPQSLSKVLKGATPTHIAARFGTSVCMTHIPALTPS